MALRKFAAARFFAGFGVPAGTLAAGFFKSLLTAASVVAAAISADALFRRDHRKSQKPAKISNMPATIQRGCANAASMTSSPVGLVMKMLVDRQH
ncbi:MAG: hypothetical protein J0I81_00820 [Hyphomicrobium sp.]|nr:hypothetical protein [Hyphomicrobium sp.]